MPKGSGRCPITQKASFVITRWRGLVRKARAWKVAVERGLKAPLNSVITEQTPIGRVTVEALHLSDDPDALEVRIYWVLAGWHPPNS